MEQKLGPLQKKFIKRLRAHPERQMQGRLGLRLEDETYKACCLGEAGLVIGSCSFKLRLGIGHILAERTGNEGLLESSFSEIGFINSVGSLLGVRVDAYAYDPSTLTSFNDNPNHSWGDWTDLSYMMEAAPEVFFTGPK